LGIEFATEPPKLPGDPAKPVSARLISLLHAAGVLAVPAGTHVIRLLPALNLSRAEADEGLAVIDKICAAIG
jgi:acetylornithine/succinyldiaminopimelate/putrescine aminotransferase